MTFPHITTGLFLLIVAMGAAAQGGGFVAGIQPDRRPDSFPRVAQVPQRDLAVALRGIDGGTSDAFGWLASQGAWFTPFTRPGMTGPYDLRGWHAERKSGAR